MKAVIILLVIGVSLCQTRYPFITKEHVEDVNKKAGFDTYKYEEHPFKDYSEERIRTLLGTVIPRDIEPVSLETVDATLPSNFDGRQAFKGCIHAIRNQQAGRCG